MKTVHTISREEIVNLTSSRLVDDFVSMAMTNQSSSLRVNGAMRNTKDEPFPTTFLGTLLPSPLTNRIIELAAKRGYWGHGAGVNFGNVFKDKDRLSKRKALLNIILDQNIKRSYLNSPMAVILTVKGVSLLNAFGFFTH